MNAYLSSRIREVFLDGTWIANTNYKDQLKDVNLEIAFRKVGDLNTIAALTWHINYYLSGLIGAFENGKLEISDKYSFELPEITTEEQWNSLVNEFLQNAGLFADKVLELDSNRLDEPFIDEKYGTYLRNVEGVIEHSYYHLGQVVLIKKIIDSQKA